MNTMERMLTATLDSGEQVTTTYQGWARITGASVKSIQKRFSRRKSQIKRGLRIMTMRTVVGLKQRPSVPNKYQSRVRKPEGSMVMANFLKNKLVV